MYLAPAVEKIAGLIENREKVDNTWLVAMLKELELKEDDFKQFRNYDHDLAQSYGRTVVYEGQNFIIYVMSWAPGDHTAIHSHGYSDWGGVVFFSDTNHRSYRAEGANIELTDISIIPKGSVVPVTGNFVHAMGNLTDTPFITLHIYGSGQAISNANDSSFLYEIEKKQLRTTNGAAYINITEEFCKKTEHNLVTDEKTLVDYLQVIRPYYRKNNLVSMVEKIEGYLADPKSYFVDNQINY
jgi:predicted metal-dependent enzyme (double-stranded beta helix superfamily)